jgi:hypothetical protein
VVFTYSHAINGLRYLGFKKEILNWNPIVASWH